MTSLIPGLGGSTYDANDDPLQKYLVELWTKIEKKQLRNQKFLDKKAQLFTDFQTRILPLEKKYGEGLVDLVEFLIPFVPRKSLSHNQREALLDWIESKLDQLRTHPFVGDIDHGALQNKLNAAAAEFMQSQNAEIEAQHIEQVRNDIEHMFDGDMQLTDEEIIALIQDPSILNQYIQSMHEEIDDEDTTDYEPHQHANDDPFDDFFGGGPFDEDDTQQHKPHDVRQKNLDKVFKAGQLNKIYKRLASLLHPDKEQDPLKKEQKHVLMQQLSEARKNKDAYTLLQLYKTHINDGEFQFDADTLGSMQTLLRQKLHLLDDELHLAKSNNDMSTLVWRKFSDRSKKRTEENFTFHIAALEDEYYEQKLLIQENNTVAKMKKLLQERVEESQYWGNPMPQNFMDMFK